MHTFDCPPAVKITGSRVIAVSDNTPELPFFSIELDLSYVPRGCRLIMSGSSDASVPLIVDDEIRINGHSYSGFSTYRANPPDNIGAEPEPIYVGVAPIDVTGDLRHGDNKLRIAFHDRGSVYCCGSIYLRFAGNV